MHALLTPTHRVISLHASRASMESAYGRIMANSLYWPHGPEARIVLCVLHTTRHKGDFVPADEFTQLQYSRTGQASAPAQKPSTSTTL